MKVHMKGYPHCPFEVEKLIKREKKVEHTAVCSFPPEYPYPCNLFTISKLQKCLANVNMSGNVELTPSKRGRILQQVHDGVPYRQIAETQDCALGTVALTIKRDRIHHTRNSLERTGRPHKLTERDERAVVRTLRKNPRLRLGDVAKQFNCSRNLIRKTAHKNGLHRRVARRKPFMSAKTVKKRIEWAKVNRDRDWNNVIFTDECSVEMGMNHRKNWVTRKAGEAYLPQMLDRTFRSNRQTLMVWGAIAHDHKWPLCRIALKASTSDGKTRTKAEGLNGRRYVDLIMNGPMLSAVNSLKDEQGGDVLVVEDGAPSHSSVVAKNFRKENGIVNLIHPPTSPDLNAIESVWMELKRRVSGITPVATNLDQLWAHLQTAWDEIPLSFINKVVESMPTRVKAVAKAKGQPTPF